MGEVASTAAAASLSSSSSLLMAATAVKGDEERYVMVASRFFRVKPGAAARHHFLDSCFLCKRSISRDRDIFMYKGDAAFCGEECRQDQMAMDEALHAAARRHRKQAAAEQAAGTARREAAGATTASMVHRRPTIANLGAVARTPVAAS
ncbi:FCS-Like Zinc finger 5-like [Triticum dicoccoides]|nr:FCS-Like Zinc finger 5-like [Triticum dicoccoides]XP_044433347.1 FCS-Like Zinc finger 5-like [Triticum aestivum]